MPDNSTLQEEFNNAVYSDDPDKVKSMLEADTDKILDIGRDYETSNYISDMLLNIACRWSDKKLVKLLLDRQHQIDINAPNMSGNPPLHSLVLPRTFTGNVDAYDIAQLLINNGANVNALNCYNNTPLHRISMFSIPEDLEMVELLLDNGANVNQQNKNGDTPLHIACRWGNLEFMKLLFSKNSEIDFAIKDNKGKTALNYIVENDKLSADKINEYIELFEEYIARHYEMECEYSIAI